MGKTKLQCGHDPEAVESDVERGRRGLLERASMRPRPGGRGEELPTPVPAPLSQLQCGHDPEAVESSAAGIILRLSG